MKIKNISAILADSLPDRIDVCETEDNNFYFLYYTDNYYLKCLTTSRDGRLISTYTFRKQIVYNFKKHKDVVLLSTYHPNGWYFVEIFDINLQSIYSVNIYKNVSSTYNSPASCLCANKTNVYYLSSHNRPLIILNRQLEFISIIGQSTSPIGAFYFPAGIKQLGCRNGHYYWLNANEFQILNQTNGFIEKSIDIVADQFEIDSNNNIIILDQTTKKIMHFSSEGLKLKEIELIDFIFKPLFFSDKLGGYNFFDRNNFDLILYD